MFLMAMFTVKSWKAWIVCKFLGLVNYITEKRMKGEFGPRKVVQLWILTLELTKLFVDGMSPIGVGLHEPFFTCWPLVMVFPTQKSMKLLQVRNHPILAGRGATYLLFEVVESDSPAAWPFPLIFWITLLLRVVPPLLLLPPAATAEIRIEQRAIESFMFSLNKMTWASSQRDSKKRAAQPIKD
jgi:hypothetical protein